MYIIYIFQTLVVIYRPQGHLAQWIKSLVRSNDAPKECEINTRWRQWRTWLVKLEQSTPVSKSFKFDISTTWKKSVQQPKRCDKQGDKDEENSPNNVQS